MARKKTRGVGSYIFYTLLTVTLGSLSGIAIAYSGGVVRNEEGIKGLTLGKEMEVKLSSYLALEQYTSLGEYTLRAENGELIEVLPRKNGKDIIRAIGVGQGRLNVYDANEEVIATIPYETTFNSKSVKEAITKTTASIAKDGKFTAAELRTVKELSLSDAELNNFCDIAMLTGLETLELKNCNVSSLAYTEESVPTSCINLYGMKGLKVVDFSNNNLTNIDALNKCTSLTKINVSNNNIAQFNVELTALKDINFRGNSMLLQNKENQFLQITSDKQTARIISAVPYSYKVCSSAAEVMAFLQEDVAFAPYVDMKSFTDKEEILLPENQEIVYFEGDSQAENDYQLSFVCTQRETVSLSFNNVSISAEGVVDFSNAEKGFLYFNQICDWASTATSKSVITANELYITCSDNAIINLNGCNAKTKDVQNDGIGGIGIRAKNVDISVGEDVEFTVRGGNGANGQVSDAGTNGTNGKKAPNSSDVELTKLDAGGKGTKGNAGNDGSAGGDGNAAIYITDAEGEVSTKTSATSSEIRFIGGDGGKGGDGGNGGKGGKGGNASVAVVRAGQEYESSHSENGKVGTGGNGGVGGAGGYGGYAGQGYGFDGMTSGEIGQAGEQGEQGEKGESGQIGWVIEEVESDETISPVSIRSNMEQSREVTA